MGEDDLMRWLALAVSCMTTFLGCTADPGSERGLRARVDGVSQCLMGPKGSIGAVAKGVRVMPNREMNIIVLEDEEYPDSPLAREWVGGTWDTPELFVIKDNKVFRPAELLHGVDLSTAAIISFEPEKVRGYSFADKSGCFYLRMRHGSEGDAGCTRERAVEVSTSECARRGYRIKGALETSGPTAWAQLIADQPWVPQFVGDMALAKDVYLVRLASPAPGVIVDGGPTVLVDARSCSVVYFAPGK